MAISRPTASELSMFRSLRSVDDVASLFGTTRRRLFFHLYSRNRPAYRTFRLSKASGGHRTIASPPDVVAAFQAKILQCLTAIVRPKDSVHGFVLGRSVATNANVHVRRRTILNVDIND